MRDQTVAAGVAQSVLEFAVSLGADRLALLAAAELGPEILSDQDARVPMARFQALMQAGQAATGEPALAIRYALDTDLRKTSIVGLIVHTAASMRDAMVQLNRYAGLMVEVDVMAQRERFSVVTRHDGIWIVDNRPDPNRFPELTEMAFGRFIGQVGRGAPDMPFAEAIEVSYPRPVYGDRYETLFGVPVIFGASRNALKISPSILALEFDAGTRYVFGIFADKADSLLAELEARRSTRGRVESVLLPRLHTGDLSADSVAADLGMSRQTLYRRLKDEATSFAEVHDALRHRMAADYLSARKTSVNQTAYLVGFSEPSSFVRAFRRWTGMTPAEFRAG